ncbi:MAG: hypothetical protein JSW68_05800, partial [Burkholderiales bacterium]
ARIVSGTRAELSARIIDILDERQKLVYARILAEASGRETTRGTVWTRDAAGQPVAAELVLGLSDGSATEVRRVLRGALEEGDEVLIGTVRAISPASSRSRRSLF